MRQVKTLLFVVAALAAAAPPSHAVPSVGGGVGAGRVAYADWFRASDDSYSWVMLVGEEGLYGGSVERGTLAVVVQEGCDDQAGELVFRDLWGWSEPDAARLEIGPAFDTASLSAPVELSGYELRVPGCDDPDFDEITETEIGPFAVEVSGSWAGFGDIGHAGGLDSGSYSRCEYVEAGGGAARQATATGSIVGSLPLLPGTDLRDLGEADYGELVAGGGAYGEGCLE